MNARPTRRVLRRLRPRTLGQALVETALVAPFLVMLLLGGAQVGSIAYDQVSLDTAAREGAREGASAPTHSVVDYATNTQWYTAGVPATYTHNCDAADFAATGNPICLGVIDSSGFLSPSTFTSNPCGTNQGCVTITVVPPASLASQQHGPPGLRLVSAPQAVPQAGSGSSKCTPTSKFAEVDVTINGLPNGMSGTLSDGGYDSPQTFPPNPATYCVKPNTLIIQAQVGSLCSGYTGQTPQTTFAANQVYSFTINLTAETCTTATTSTTSSTTTTSSSSTTTASTTSTSSVTGPTTGCQSHPVDDSYYFTVTVKYPAPIFIPFINNLFQTSTGIRMITTSVTYPVDPCTMTGNGQS